MTTAEQGSEIARRGFQNEDDIVDKFNNWSIDFEAQKWLLIMGYNMDEIEYVKAIKIFREKTDVQVQVTIKLRGIIDAQNLQVKLVSIAKGFNQIDKRWIDNYANLWAIPNDINNILKRYTGEILPSIQNPRDERRMFADEFSTTEQQLLLNWLINNHMLIVSDILKGRGRFAAEWMLVAQIIEENARWVLKPMNYCINFFGAGKIVITNRGCVKMGRITMQRKGGDGGRDTAKMLQFKIDPSELFHSAS